MFRIDLLQNEWLLLAMAGGLALIAGVVLVCLAVWMPRQKLIDESSAQALRQPLTKWLRFLPLLLIVTYVAVAVFAIVYTLTMAAYPPNW